MERSEQASSVDESMDDLDHGNCCANHPDSDTLGTNKEDRRTSLGRDEGCMESYGRMDCRGSERYIQLVQEALASARGCAIWSLRIRCCRGDQALEGLDEIL